MLYRSGQGRAEQLECGPFAGSIDRRLFDSHPEPVKLGNEFSRPQSEAPSPNKEARSAHARRVILVRDLPDVAGGSLLTGAEFA